MNASIEFVHRNRARTRKKDEHQGWSLHAHRYLLVWPMAGSTLLHERESRKRRKIMRRTCQCPPLRERYNMWKSLLEKTSLYSDTPLIDHLVMREFVSGPPSYRFIYERVRDRKPSLRKDSWAVCGFRTEFFEKRQFFGSSFSFKFRVFEENSPFVDPDQQMVRFSSNTRNLNENELPKNCRFSKNSVLNPQTAHEPFLRLGVLSRTLSYMKR